MTAPRIIRTAGADIAYTDVGEGSPVLVLHGFTGDGASMAAIGDTLVERHRVITCDLVGHGSSAAPVDVARYTTGAIVEQLTGLLDALDVARADVVGYSLGGRLALSLACAHPDRVRRLALIGTTAGIEDPAARVERRAADEALADRLDADGVEAFVDHWEALPIFATQAALPADVQAAIRATRTRQRSVGLANSLRGVGAGVMPSLWSAVGNLSAPTLLIAGSLDERYVEIGRRLAARMPDARLEIVADVGHAAHLEAPDTVAALVADHLR